MDIPVYLDYAASTPVAPSVAAAMHECLSSAAGTANPAAIGHGPGRAAAALVEQGGQRVAELIGAEVREIVWVSGATEADNLAVVGAAHFRQQRGRHLVTAINEHPAVLESCRYLERQGFVVTYLRPDHQGLVGVEQVTAAIRDDTILVSLMHVNNETGVIHDIAAIGALCRQRDVLLHVDAAQSAGRLPLNVRAQAVDLLSLSAHKMGGPKGIGALFIDAERLRRVEPLLHGGGQQRGLRPGTLATHQIHGMGLAAQLAAANLHEEPPRLSRLRDRLWQQLQHIDGLLLNGHPTQRACHILNFSVTGVAGESLLLALDDLALASGSACATASEDASPGLRSLGRDDQLAQNSLRISLGADSCDEQIDFAASRIQAEITRLRRVASLPQLADA